MGGYHAVESRIARRHRVLKAGTIGFGGGAIDWRKQQPLGVAFD
jgi:hypothetical protein